MRAINAAEESHEQNTDWMGNAFVFEVKRVNVYFDSVLE